MATLTASATITVLKKNDTTLCTSTMRRRAPWLICTSETWAVMPMTKEK